MAPQIFLTLNRNPSHFEHSVLITVLIAFGNFTKTQFFLSFTEENSLEVIFAL